MTGKQLGALLRKHDISQSEIARRTPLSQVYLSAIIRSLSGKAPVSQMVENLVAEAVEAVLEERKQARLAKRPRRVVRGAEAKP